MEENSKEKMVEKLVNDVFKKLREEKNIRDEGIEDLGSDDDEEYEEKLKNAAEIFDVWDDLDSEEKAETLINVGSELIEYIYNDIYHIMLHIAKKFFFRLQIVVAASTLILYLLLK